MLCHMVQVYQHFTGSCCLQYHGRWWWCRQQDPLQHPYMSTRLQGYHIPCDNNVKKWYSQNFFFTAITAHYVRKLYILYTTFFCNIIPSTMVTSFPSAMVNGITSNKTIICRFTTRTTPNLAYFPQPSMYYLIKPNTSKCQSDKYFDYPVMKPNFWDAEHYHELNGLAFNNLHLHMWTHVKRHPQKLILYI